MSPSSFPLIYCDHWDHFVKERNDAIGRISDPTNNLIIRLDKLIRGQNLEWTSQKEFEKHVVPWDGSGDFCELCKIRFTLTRRRHHCRLCGVNLCGRCSDFLSFKSAERLTGIESSVISSSLSNDHDNFGEGLFGLSLSVDKPNQPQSNLKSSSDVNMSFPTLGNTLSAMRRGVEKLSAVQTIIGNGEEKQDRSLRICLSCKALLDRRERTMELRVKNDAFLDTYQQMCALLSQISQLASVYHPMAESLNKGGTLYSLATATSLRLKLKTLQEETLRICSKIENWEGAINDQSLTSPPFREVLLRRNIKMLALHTLHEVLNIELDLPSAEQYELRKKQYKKMLERQTERETFDMNGFEQQTSKSSNYGIKSANNILTRKIGRNRPSSSFSEILMGVSKDGGMDTPSTSEQNINGRNGSVRQSSSFTGMNSAEESWMPSGNPLVEQKQNPFLSKEMDNWHPLQEQYLITKNFLEQATLAGRLEEMRILERNLGELEQEMKNMDLQKPEL